ncbi:hypothetical protein PCASD_20825 [Puccinia coronata f. sp. avenae]|uniref:BED-type domain-containing protein n=1 Tax=Puccinia coronata f. sp. avenae TaxID=200324 RepID=A0A2N5S657_9BASI|nr:hypothetical protein PCASD_20825 [Puccinia coronata f. sp. avenae]
MKRKKDNNNRDTDNNSAPNPSSQTITEKIMGLEPFIESKETGEAICQVALAVKNGKICGSCLKKDKSGSTKNLHGHLLSVHRLVDPNLSNKKSNTIDIKKWAKKAKLDPKIELNSGCLKDALVYFLAKCDLPFAVVERKSFRNLVRLINELAIPLMNQMNQKSIATQIARVHLQFKEEIKRHLCKEEFISFTHDAWTAPNVTAFMAVTAHFVTKNFKLKDITLAVPHVQGNHTGKTFADLFYDVLNNYDGLKKIHTITANNASTNNKMAHKLSLQINSFKPQTCLLGCIHYKQL